MITAIALALALLVFVAAIVRVASSQFAVTKPERDNERALQMAEAGANAYVNMLTRGPAASSVTNYQLLPQQTINPTVLTLQQFKIQSKNGTIPASQLIHYPVGNTTQGYYAYQTAAINASGGGDIVAFGWSNGVVRRVKVRGQVRGLFDWPAVYGISPTDALNIKNIKITGSWGGEGPIDTTGSTGLTGPTFLAGAGVAANPPPTGWPNVTYSSRSLGIPTADQEANQQAYANYGMTTTQGVEYYRTHNNNTTGIKYLVQDNTTGKIRELSDSAKWAAPSTAGTQITLNTSFQSGKKSSGNAIVNSDLTAAGMTGNETFYGLRVYPGDYYFTDIQAAGQYLYGRDYADGNQPAADPLKPLLATADGSNPNSGMAAKTDIRLWIGDTSPGIISNLDSNIVTEEPLYPGRFRLYDANEGSKNPPAKGNTSISAKQTNLFISMLAYNTDSNGNGYGQISVETQSTITGSVIGWTVDTHGNSVTINKGTPDPGNTDGFLFSITNWKELP